jgi:alpha-beta hydrolase superfamily lysophospholipase
MIAMSMRLSIGICLLAVAPALQAEGAAPFDAATAFGARPSVEDLSLSPDGKRVAYIAPMAGQGATLYTVSLERGSRTTLKEESRNFTNFSLVSDFIGDGPHMHEGSPIEHADKIKVPVLLFHGSSDTNVNIAQSKHMAEKLKAAGARCDLVTWDGLDHYLDDSSARAQMLSRSDAFLREAFGSGARNSTRN